MPRVSRFSKPGIPRLRPSWGFRLLFALYRMTSKTYPDSTAANCVYDLVGKIRGKRRVATFSSGSITRRLFVGRKRERGCAPSRAFREGALPNYRNLTLRCPRAASRPLSSHFSCTAITDTQSQSRNNSQTVQHRELRPSSETGPSFAAKTIVSSSLTKDNKYTNKAAEVATPHPEKSTPNR